METKNEIIKSGNALMATEQQRAIAETQAAMIIALKFPRNEQKAIDKIIIACQRIKLAEAAVYSYPRGNQEISGPSIRLAEVLAQNWGNIQFGIRELSQSNGESTVQAFAWDIETNTKQIKEFQEPHIRYSKKHGNTELTDPRDIYELVANNGARRLRACILGVIPKDISEMAIEECEKTLSAKADTSPAAIKKMLDKFSELKVTKKMLEKKIGRKIDTIPPATLLQLRKIYNSLRWISSISDWFDITITISISRF